MKERGEGFLSRKASSAVARSLTLQTFPGVRSVRGARLDEGREEHAPGPARAAPGLRRRGRSRVLAEGRVLVFSPEDKMSSVLR